MDKRFLPEEITTIEKLHQLMDEKRFIEIAKFLKWARQNLAKLDPLRFALFTKFKANLLRLGLKLSDTELLELTPNEIAEQLQEQFGMKKEKVKQKIEQVQEEQQEESPKEQEEFGKIPETEEEMIKQVVTADVSLIEDERQNFRKSILDEKYKCKIKKGGSFNIKMNKKGTRIEITVPSSWELEIEDAIILDQYDQRFSQQVIRTKQKNLEVEQKEQETQQDKQSLETKEEEKIQKKQVIEQEKKTITKQEKKSKQIQISTVTDFIYDKLKEGNDFYQIRNSLSKYLRKQGIPEKYKDIQGGDTKIAGEILRRETAELIKSGKVKFSDLEGRFGSQTLKKISKILEEENE